MSEIPTQPEIMEQPVQPNAENTADEPKPNGSGQAKRKLSRTKTLPDWKPLGSIRDYFVEQMRQDDIRR